MASQTRRLELRRRHATVAPPVDKCHGQLKTFVEDGHKCTFCEFLENGVKVLKHESRNINTLARTTSIHNDRFAESNFY